MGYTKLVFSNIRSKPLRTILTITAVMICITLLLTLLGFFIGYNNAMKDELATLGVQIMAVPKGCPYSATTLILHGGKIPNEIPIQGLDEIRAVKGVDQAEAVVMGELEFMGGTRVIYGTTPKFPSLKSAWKINGQYPTGDNQAMLGSLAASDLGKKIGDTFEINKVQLTVTGLLESTGGSEDNFIYTTDTDARKIMGDRKGFTAVLVKVNQSDPSYMTTVSDAIEKVVDTQPVSINQVNKTVSDLLASARALMLSVTFVAIIAAAVVVSGASIISVIERTKQIGMLKAIGATPLQVSGAIVIESTLLTFFGGLLGVGLTFLLKLPLSNLLGQLITAAPRSEELVQLPTPIVLIALAISVGVGIVSAIAPLIRIANVPSLKMAG
jgi:putative ABC transport system permease protein